jgi:hypothetical protein
MSKRLDPAAIISIAQQARPKVIGQRADLRAQFTTGAAVSIAFAPTVRRTKFVMESTVVSTKPSSCSAMMEEMKSKGRAMKLCEHLGHYRTVTVSSPWYFIPQPSFYAHSSAPLRHA